jgi:hypothetical protein
VKDKPKPKAAPPHAALTPWQHLRAWFKDCLGFTRHPLPHLPETPPPPERTK